MKKDTGMLCPTTHDTGKPCTGCEQCDLNWTKPGSAEEHVFIHAARAHHYPKPDSPHTSVLNRHVDQSQAFEAGWAECRATLASGQAQPAVNDYVALFLRCAYPVAHEIDPRGYRWCESWLDSARTAALAAAQPAAAPAAPIKTWQDRAKEDGNFPCFSGNQTVPYLKAEIADLRAALAARKPAAPMEIALRKIMEAHRFNVASMSVTEVHACAFDALTAAPSIPAAISGELDWSFANDATTSEALRKLLCREPTLREVTDIQKAVCARETGDASTPPSSIPAQACETAAPNATTREAMAELDSGKGKRFSSVEALMSDLVQVSDDGIPAQAGVPDGYVLMPEKITDDMCVRGAEATCGHIDWEADHVSDGSEACDMVEAIYNALILSAPSAPAAPVQGGPRASDPVVVASVRGKLLAAGFSPVQLRTLEEIEADLAMGGGLGRTARLIDERCAALAAQVQPEAVPESTAAVLALVTAIHKVLIAGGDYGDDLSDIGLRKTLKDAEIVGFKALVAAGIDKVPYSVNPLSVFIEDVAQPTKPADGKDGA